MANMRWLRGVGADQGGIGEFHVTWDLLMALAEAASF